MNVVWIILIAVIVLRVGWRIFRKSRPAGSKADTAPKKPLGPRGRQFYTVWAFFIVNIRRLFRDRLALFFTFLFPLIFLFVFGGLNSGNKSVSFHVAVINNARDAFAKDFVTQLHKQKALKIDDKITTFSAANEKMSRGELDATLELPAGFGA